MKKSVKIGLIVVLVLVVGIIWIGDYFSDEEVVDEKDSGGEIVLGCVQDSDCVKVQTTCCSCTSGGEEECVLSSEVGDYEKNLDECEDPLFCIALYNCEIESCGCVDGVCVG